MACLRIAGATRRSRGGSTHPVALALERVGRQRHAPARLAVAEGGPIDREALAVQASQAVEYRRRISLTAVERFQPDSSLGEGFLSQCDRAGARADLDERAEAQVAQREHPVQEAHRLPGVVAPILRGWRRGVRTSGYV